MAKKLLTKNFCLPQAANPSFPRWKDQTKTAYSHSPPSSDAQRLAQKLTAIQAKSAVVIGAGLIGISVTEALTETWLKSYHGGAAR